MQFQAIEKLILDNEVKFVDLRFSDTLGKEHHVSVPSQSFIKVVENGQPFDGSSIAGWKDIENSDMILKPDLSTIKFDPFYEQNTLFVTCDIIDPGLDNLGKDYIKCPRGIARRAEEFIKNSGVADTAYFGPEPEFFVFDSITWGCDHSGSHVKIVSDESAWATSENIDGGNMGHRPLLKGGYFPVPPVDSLQDLRSEICTVLENLDIPTEVHHHEVATAGQCEVGTKFSSLVERADWSQIFRYVVQNVAHRFGKTATFMPKPIVGDNGSGMHVHQSLWKNGINLFAGDLYAGLSQTALYYIGGIIKHAKALNAITNPGTNSYKRLVPGFEAPTFLAYSARNRSASIRIPYTATKESRRVEARFPDPLANPYLAFSALLMAGIDGVINKINPGDAVDLNLYELSNEKIKSIPQVSSSLEMALEHLDKDREFLKVGSVFSDEVIDSYIKIKMKEVELYRMTTHPIEFSMYYSL